MNILLSIWGDAFIVCGLGLSIVFIVLIALVFILNGFTSIFTKKIRIPKHSNKKAISKTEEFHEIHLSTTDSAAIATAISLYYHSSDFYENQTITIKKIERRYSPWSSKIYGINNLVR